MTPEIAAVIEAARALVEGRRKFLGLPADRILPGSWEARLEKAVAAMTAADPVERRP